MTLDRGRTKIGAQSKISGVRGMLVPGRVNVVEDRPCVRSEG